jgi:hypothetical protein
MVRSGSRAVAMLAGAVLLTLGACTATTTTAGPAVGGSAPGITGATTPAATTPASTAPPAATPSVVIATVSADTTLFVTPSGNIACALTATGARCDIGDRSWVVPAKPASCQLDYGNGVSVNASGAAVSCAGDTLLHSNTNVLAYGHGIRNGQVQCVSQPTGVRCEYLAGGHGFTIAKEAYTLFWPDPAAARPRWLESSPGWVRGSTRVPILTHALGRRPPDRAPFETSPPLRTTR